MELTPSYLTWSILALILILNPIIFFNDPFKYSNSSKCLHLTCRRYSLIMALVILAIDMILAISLTLINPLPYLPKFWFIPYTIIVFMIILLHFNESKIVVKDKRFTPPPEFFFRKKTRIVCRAILASLYLLIIVARFASESQPTISTQTKPERFLYNRFGGLHSQNVIPFFLSWLTIIALPVAGLRLYQEITYHPSKYNQPLAWHY